MLHNSYVGEAARPFTTAAPIQPLVPPAPPTPAPTPTGGPFFRCVKGRSEISLRVHHRETAQRCAARHKPSNVGRFLLELLYFKFLPFKGLQLERFLKKSPAFNAPGPFLKLKCGRDPKQTERC